MTDTANETLTAGDRSWILLTIGAVLTFSSLGEATIEELLELKEKLLRRRNAISEKIKAVEKSIEVFEDDLDCNAPLTGLLHEITSRDRKSVASTTRAVLQAADRPLRVQEVESVVRKFHDDVRDNYVAEVLSRMYRNGKAKRTEPRTYVAA